MKRIQISKMYWDKYEKRFIAAAPMLFHLPSKIIYFDYTKSYNAAPSK